MSESVIERLGLIEPDWADVTRRSQRLRKRNQRRRALLAIGGVLTAAVLAGGAYAAARVIWGGHDMTPADIERQATVVTNDTWAVCSGQNGCATKTGTHKQVDILPSMGVVFILPDGRHEVDIVPASAIVGMPRDLGTTKPILDTSGKSIGGTWTFSLPGGRERTITWNRLTGATKVADRGGGITTTTPLQAGDVLPLIPGSLTADPRTLDKAVTFDLPTSNRVIIFPQLNETYIDSPETQAGAEPLPYDTATQYGLTPIGHYNGKLPVSPSGGTWTVHLQRLTSTVTWHTGDSFVTVQLTNNSRTTTTRVPIGHEIPLVPFN
jgi:hypothetical protein